MQKTGSCLCGAVTVVAHDFDTNMGVCHCDMCQKWVGGPFMATDCGQRVEFQGSQHITRFNSSEWAERGFCNKCGSALFYYLKSKSQYIMAVGLFADDPKGIHFDHQIFIDKKPTYYDFANQTKNMTEEEVMASD